MSYKYFASTDLFSHSFSTCKPLGVRYHHSYLKNKLRCREIKAIHQSPTLKSSKRFNSNQCASKSRDAEKAGVLGNSGRGPHLARCYLFSTPSLSRLDFSKSPFPEQLRNPQQSSRMLLRIPLPLHMLDPVAPASHWTPRKYLPHRSPSSVVLAQEGSTAMTEKGEEINMQE